MARIYIHRNVFLQPLITALISNVHESPYVKVNGVFFAYFEQNAYFCIS